MTTSGPQATQAAVIAVSDWDVAAEHSRIGPLYATINDSMRQQSVAAGRNQVSTGLSEILEAHLAAGGGGGGGEAVMEYNISLNSNPWK